MDAGIGALVKELESARDSEGGVVDWPGIVNRARGLGAHLGAAEADYRALVTDANKRLAEASRQVQQFQRPGVGAAAATGGSQTVYISAGATAGIAAGALLLGGVGGYAAKAYMDGRKRKKAAEASENPSRELPEHEEPEEREEERDEREEAPRRRRAKR
jgi:hypothetical protein